MNGATILVVDDEREFGEVLGARLRRRGFTVEVALSGPEALERLRAETDPDGIEVVVLDIRMPGMDGIETLREIKAERPLVEALMLTGYGSVDSAVEAVKCGAFDYLMKPCDLDELAAKATAAAKRKRDHEAELFKARMKPYISRREKEKLMAKAFE